MASGLSQLESDIARILEKCRSDIRSWNELDAAHRWSRINSATEKSEREIMQAVRNAWHHRREQE
jgi:hypothetical protein